MKGSLGGGSPAPLPPFVWARLRWPLRCRLATAALSAGWLSSRQQQPMARLLPWEVRPAGLVGPRPPGLHRPGRACRVGGGPPGSLGAGGRAGRGRAAGRGLARPPLPRPPAVPVPRVPRPDPRPLLSPPPWRRRWRRLLLSPTGPPVPLALTAAGLARPGRPGRGQAATFSSPPPPPPPPCWPFAHRIGGPIAPQPPVGPAPALTRVGVGAGREGPGKSLFVSEAPVKGTWSREA